MARSDKRVAEMHAAVDIAHEERPEKQDLRREEHPHAQACGIGLSLEAVESGAGRRQNAVSSTALTLCELRRIRAILIRPAGDMQRCFEVVLRRRRFGLPLETGCSPWIARCLR